MHSVYVLLLIDALLLAAAGYFSVVSFKEKETRAAWVGMAAAAAMIALAGLVIRAPGLRIAVSVLFGTLSTFGLALFLPARGDPRALKGASGAAVGAIERFDERDVVFARNRSLPPGSDVYRRYYAAHPERERRDAGRRQKGGPVGRVGAIDDGYRPNVAMIQACFEMPGVFGKMAEAAPSGDALPEQMDPVRAACIIKGLARRLGADLVGICRVNPAWAYSHRGEIFYGNWEDWGREIPEPLPFAVVIAAEMDHANVGAGPHTPALFESAFNYGKGAFITTILARWFAGMGYRAAAQHSRHYDLNLVPLAIDAGLGELGRFGYLIADKFGPRVRLFAVTTDMPLAVDRPIDLGADEFCRRCRKCAASCPSKSIPAGGKTVVHGIEKWKLDAESCFEYWGRVGTDCSVCMGVCPFSRPDRGIHRLVRRTIRRSALARRVLPHLDNFIYGKRWRPRPAPEWIGYPDSSVTKPSQG
jgi:reductive dehalogenase